MHLKNYNQTNIKKNIKTGDNIMELNEECIFYSIKPKRKNLTYFESLSIMLSENKKNAAKSALSAFKPSRYYILEETVGYRLNNGIVRVKNTQFINTLSKKELEKLAK